MNFRSMMIGVALGCLAALFGVAGCASAPSKVHVYRETDRAERVQSTRVLVPGTSDESQSTARDERERVVRSEPVVW